MLLQTDAECGTRAAIGRSNNKHCLARDLSCFTIGDPTLTSHIQQLQFCTELKGNNRQEL